MVAFMLIPGRKKATYEYDGKDMRIVSRITAHARRMDTDQSDRISSTSVLFRAGLRAFV